MASLDTQIDELYQLPLDEFTPARNALAKTLKGPAKSQVTALAKPPIPLWAINQLYWQAPGTYKALIDASEKLRAAHRAVLGGKKSDLQKAGDVHRGTLERAVANILALLKRKGVPLSESATAGIRRTLAALPDDGHPGRLTREPAPAGFSLLAGVAIKARPVEVAAAPPKRSAEKEAEKEKVAERERQRAEEAKRRRAEKARQALDAARRAEIRAANQLKAAERRLADLEKE